MISFLKSTSAKRHPEAEIGEKPSPHHRQSDKVATMVFQCLADWNTSRALAVTRANHQLAGRVIQSISPNRPTTPIAVVLPPNVRIQPAISTSPEHVANFQRYINQFPDNFSRSERIYRHNDRQFSELPIGNKRAAESLRFISQFHYSGQIDGQIVILSQYNITHKPAQLRLPGSKSAVSAAASPSEADYVMLLAKRLSAEPTLLPNYNNQINQRQMRFIKQAFERHPFSKVDKPTGLFARIQAFALTILTKIGYRGTDAQVREACKQVLNLIDKEVKSDRTLLKIQHLFSWIFQLRPSPNAVQNAAKKLVAKV